MNIEILNRIQDLADELARCRERERILKEMLDTDALIGKETLRLVLNHPASVDEEPIKATEAQIEVKPEPVEEKPKPKRGKRSTVDKGKIQALKNAGWTVKQVAEECGCSVGAVYSVLNKSAETTEEVVW